MSTGLSMRFPQTPQGVSYLSPGSDAIFSSKQNHPSPIGTSPAEDRFHMTPQEKSNTGAKSYDLFCSKSNPLEIHSFFNAEFPGYPKSNTNQFNNQFERSFVSSLSNDKSPRFIQPTQGLSPRIFENSPSPVRDYDDLNNEQSWDEWITGMGGMEGMEANDYRYGEYISRQVTPMRDLSPFSHHTTPYRDLSPFSRQTTPMRDSSSLSQTPPIRDQSPFTRQHLIQLRDPSPFSRQATSREVRYPSPSRPLTSASDSGRLMKPSIVTTNDKNYHYTNPAPKKQMQNWTDPVVRRGRSTKPPPQNLNFYHDNRTRSRSPSPAYYGPQKGQESYSISPSPSPPLSPHIPSTKGNQTPSMNLRVQSPLKQVPNSHLQVSQSAPDNDRQRNNFEGEDAKAFYINIHQSTNSPTLSPRPSPSKNAVKPLGPSSLSSSPSHHHSQYRYRHKAKANRHRHSNKKDDYLSKFEIHLDRIFQGEDLRATLMVKNIPNKYDQEMLLETINKKFKGTYDFFYLPIDFKNKCNVGYAFINFIDYTTVARFFDEFNQKRWEKFNSEKVCCVAYARIQGKLAFIDHFRNSSLMSEDPSCRPLIFFSNGPKMGTMEPFPPANMSPVRARYVSNDDD